MAVSRKESNGASFGAQGESASVFWTGNGLFIKTKETTGEPVTVAAVEPAPETAGEPVTAEEKKLVLTPRKPKLPTLAGWGVGGGRRGQGASNGFKSFSTRASTYVSTKEAVKAAEEVRGAASIDLYAEAEDEDEWDMIINGYGSKSTRDNTEDDETIHFTYLCHVAKNFVGSTLEQFIGCLAQYSMIEPVDDDILGEIEGNITGTRRVLDTILLTILKEDQSWEEKCEIVMDEAAKVDAWLEELTTTFGESASRFLLVNLEKHRSVLATAAKVDEYLTLKLDKSVFANNAFSIDNFQKNDLTMINLYDASLKKAADYMKCLHESISMPVKSAKEGLTSINKHISAGTFTLESLVLTARKAITRLSAAVISVENLYGSDFVVNEMNAVLGTLAKLERYDITPQQICEDIGQLHKLVGALTRFMPEVPKFEPPMPRDGRQYTCSCCKSTNHVIAFCPLTQVKCKKCKCAGLLCKPSTNDVEGVCDPFGIMSLVTHFFFLEIAKFSVSTTDELPFFCEFSRTIVDVTPKIFGSVVAILLDDKRQRSAAAAPFAFKESVSFNRAVASPQCQAFLRAHQKAIAEEQSRREAARLADEEKLVAEQSFFESLRQKNTVAVAAAHVQKTEVFEWEAPREVLAITKRLAAAVEEETNEVSDDSDEEDADEELANDPTFKRGGTNHARSVQVDAYCWGENPFGGRFGKNHKGRGKGQGHQSKFSSNGE